MKFIAQLFGGRGSGSGRYSYYLPKDPSRSKRLKDVTDPRKSQNSNYRNYKDKNNNLEIEFHPGQPGQAGWRGKDHYHVLNPHAKGKYDYYLDKNGNPCPKGSKESHLTPGEYENLLRGLK